MIINLYIGEDKLEMFKDESVSINSSIADVSDITKNTTEYTKDFTVPASDVNNKIFKHYYNANIDGGFDARVKVDGRIELDGILFKRGKFRLNKVSLKNGVPSYYNINFWGNLVSLNDKLKKDYLTDLDLTALDHAYDSTTVKTGLTTSLFSGNLVYVPLIKKQLYYNNNASDNTQTDLLANIAYGGGANTGILFTDLRPAIKLIKIIEAIETKYSITFSRDFFGSDEFTNLFLWLNPDTENDAGGGTQTIDWDGGDTDYINLTTNAGSFPCRRSTSGADDHLFWNFRLSVYPSSGYETVEYDLIFVVDGNEEARITNVGTTYDFGVFFNKEGVYKVYNCEWQVKSSQEFKFTANIWQKKTDRTLSPEVYIYNTTATENTIDSYFTISENLPKIKTIDFIKGIFNMAKLIITPITSSHFYVNNIDDYYAEGQLFNLTRYTDYADIEVSRGDILNEVNMKFKDPTTLLNIQYDKNNGIPYGNSEILIKDDSGELLDGSSLDFELPFEQIIYERLYDNNDETLTNFQYGAIINENADKANPKAHIFYNINQQIGTKTIGYINDLGSKEVLNTTINLPSHTNTFESQLYSTLFNNEFSTWDGSLIQNTLYSNYHKTYLDAIFNVKRRNFKYTVHVPLRIITELSLNDVIQIKNNYYRIDNYELDLITGKTEFNLINSFDNTIASFYPSVNILYANYQEQTQSIYVVNLTSYTADKVDVGFGTSWVTITDSDSTLYFAFSENTSYQPRTMRVTITNSETLQEFTVTLYQQIQLISTDNNYITIDNNIITIDTN